MKLQEKIIKAIEDFIQKNNIEEIEIQNFELDKNPLFKWGNLGWGWGRVTGNLPQPYSWVTYDPTGRNIQVDIFRGKNGHSWLIDFDGNIISEETKNIVCWEEVEKRIDIENQFENMYLDILDSILLDEDVQLSYQASKNTLHAKTMKVETLIVKNR